MKTIFLTSKTKHYHKINNKKIANAIDNTNGIVEQIKNLLEKQETILYIAASPDDFKKNEEYSNLIFEGFNLSGVKFANNLVLDSRTIEQAREYISKADLIFLSGGDTYIENEFFKKIRLKELLSCYNGIIVGQSAGAINLAEHVYNSPEEGIDSEPIYFEGLGLSQINVEPHFELNSSNFDDYEVYQRNHLLNESKKRKIYALCDGSHILETDEQIIVYGESYLISDGAITKLCSNKEYKNITPTQTLKL